MTEKNILITGGGTGGHLYPAVAVIEEIRKKYPGTTIIFIGSRKGSGKRLIEAMGIKFYTVRARGLAGSSNRLRKILVYIMFFLDLIPGFFKSLFILRKNNIQMVLGMGGYICAPVLLAAIASGTRFALHEQNFIPGRLNKLFSGRARYFFTSFKDTKKYLKQGSGEKIFSGNPVRKSIKEIKKIKPDYKKWGLSKERFTITAFGGSQGAMRLNEYILELGKLKVQGKGIQVLLITGARFYESISEKIRGMYPNNDMAVKIFSYIDEIEEVYRITDLIIARAGANTVFEITATGIPSILIPYPFAIDDHQTYNARYLEQHGRAVLIKEKDLKPGLLEKKIKVLLKDGMKIYNRMRDSETLITSMDSAGIISEKLMEDMLEKK
jgi:UDP-N-acetylglucosamine--N-acetylmuramyl-(pentapeptide) pyrophosphoryl-undecaprenol N-acetylglucosamine transferase